MLNRNCILFLLYWMKNNWYFQTYRLASSWNPCSWSCSFFKQQQVNFQSCGWLLSRQFTGQRFGHISKQCRNSGTKQMVVFVKRKPEIKKKRYQTRWHKFKESLVSVMEFPFCNIVSLTEFQFAVNSPFPSLLTISVRGQNLLKEVRLYTHTKKQICHRTSKIPGK